MASFGLPRFVLLSTNSKKFVTQTNESISGYLRCTGTDIKSSAIKFEMEMAKTWDDGSLFNIRSCRNNKYWRMDSPDSNLVMAAADKPNEDCSQWSCTLFQAVRVQPDDSGNNLTIQLKCVHNQKPVTVAAAAPDHIDSLYIRDDDGRSSKLRVTDAESLLILPKTVAFKASNGKYLQPLPGHKTVTPLGTEIGNPHVPFYITYNNPDGYARLTLKENNLVLYNEDQCMQTLPYSICFPFVVALPGSDRSPPSLDDAKAMFKPIKVVGPKFKDGKVVSSTTIALRSAANNQLVRYDERNGMVLADASSITHNAVFTVEEPVLSRRIYNVKFHLADSRIYDESIVSLVTKQVSNFNKEPQVEHLTLKYEQKTTSTFDRSVSASVGVETSFQTGIPFIAEGKIDISVDVEGSLGWHDTTEKTQDLETTQDVTVDPMTTVIASVVATKGKCDVPFSYSQSDTLFDGTEVITEMDDGIYRGVSSWNFHCETTSKPLLPKA